MWNWILQNKTWLFSGGGITVFAIGWWMINKLGSGGQPQVNINVSPTISPVISPTQSNMQNAASDGSKHPITQLVPDIKALTYKAAFARGIGAGKSCFIMSFRNDGLGDATNVIAHIGYGGGSGQKLLVDYGGWIEHQPIMDIGRGHTKNLIIGITDDGKNFAVTDIAPATNYTQFRLVEVGEITPGEWKMMVTLSADNFRRDYIFDLTVGHEGSFLCNPEGMARPPQKQNPPKPDTSAQPTVGSLRPEITTVVYDEESDVWSKGSGEGAITAALLSFSNDTTKLRRRASVRGIRARLTYYKRDGIEEFRRIDSGCWIGQAYRYADLEVGDIAYLIASIQGNGQAATVGNPRHSVARYSEDHTVVDDLPEGTYEIKVDLVGEDGEYAETYWFQLDVCEQLKVKRINQRAA
jgi:hypothetical protein